MSFHKTIATCVTLFLLSTGIAVGQVQQPPQQQPPQQQQQPQMPDVPTPDEISDDELETFVEASDAIQPIQEKAQSDLQQVIRDEGMEIERFQQIMMAMQNPQMADQVDMTPEEEESLQVMQPKLMEIEVEASDEIRNEIADSGLDVDRYQAIFMSLQQHPELMQRLEQLMDG